MNYSTFLANLNLASDLRQPTHKHDHRTIELAAKMARVEMRAYSAQIRNERLEKYLTYSGAHELLLVLPPKPESFHCWLELCGTGSATNNALDGWNCEVKKGSSVTDSHYD